jgi:hypothetical protein
MKFSLCLAKQNAMKTYAENLKFENFSYVISVCQEWTRYLSPQPTVRFSKY